MLLRIHVGAGLMAVTLIAAFWSATVLSELFGTPAEIAWVKRAILWGLALLVPALATTGATGFRLGLGRAEPEVKAKRRRMPIIAANGLLVLVPCAVVLAEHATAGLFDATFYAVQAVELLAGAVNLTLMALNIRDGRRLGRRWATMPG